MRYQSVIIDPRKVLPSRHSIFIRGLTGNVEIDDVKDLFSKASDGKCKVDFFSYSEDREFLFVAIRFESHQLAKEMIAKYDGNRLFGQKVDVTWFKDIRKARKKVIENGPKYHNLLASFDGRRSSFGRFHARRPVVGPRRFGNGPPFRLFRPPFMRQRVSSSDSSTSESHHSSDSESSHRIRKSRKRGRSTHKKRHTSRRDYSASGSENSSTSTSGSPSTHPNVAKKSMQSNDVQPVEKEVLQAALKGYSTSGARSPSKEARLSSRNTSTPKHTDSKQISPETGPVGGPTSSTDQQLPKRKRAKRSKKHGRSYRHGKRKRCDAQVVACLSQSQSSEVELDIPIVQLNSSEQQKQQQESEDQGLHRQLSQQSQAQTIPSPLSVDCDQDGHRLNVHVNRANVQMIMDQEVEEKGKNRETGEEPIQGELERSPQQTLMQNVRLEDICLPQDPLNESNKVKEGSQNATESPVPEGPELPPTESQLVPEGPALPEDDDLIEPNEAVYVGEGPELPPDMTESMNETPDVQPIQNGSSKPRLYSPERELEMQPKISNSVTSTVQGIPESRPLTAAPARRTLLELPEHLIKHKTQQERQTEPATNLFVQSFEETSQQQLQPQQQHQQQHDFYYYYYYYQQQQQQQQQHQQQQQLEQAQKLQIEQARQQQLEQEQQQQLEQAQQQLLEQAQKKLLEQEQQQKLELAQQQLFEQAQKKLLEQEQQQKLKQAQQQLLEKAQQKLLEQEQQQQLEQAQQQLLEQEQQQKLKQAQQQLLEKAQKKLLEQEQQQQFEQAHQQQLEQEQQQLEQGQQQQLKQAQQQLLEQAQKKLLEQEQQQQLEQARRQKLEYSQKQQQHSYPDLLHTHSNQSEQPSRQETELEPYSQRASPTAAPTQQSQQSPNIIPQEEEEQPEPPVWSASPNQPVQQSVVEQEEEQQSETQPQVESQIPVPGSEDVSEIVPYSFSGDEMPVDVENNGREQQNEVHSGKVYHKDMSCQTIQMEPNSEPTDSTESNNSLLSALLEEKLEEIFRKKRLIEAAYREECEQYTTSVAKLIRIQDILNIQGYVHGRLLIASAQWPFILSD